MSRCPRFGDLQLLLSNSPSSTKPLNYIQRTPHDCQIYCSSIVQFSWFSSSAQELLIKATDLSKDNKMKEWWRNELWKVIHIYCWLFEAFSLLNLSELFLFFFKWQGFSCVINFVQWLFLFWFNLIGEWCPLCATSYEHETNKWLSIFTHMPFVRSKLQDM